MRCVDTSTSTDLNQEVVTSLGKFALTGPLQPRIWIDADKQTVMWDAVSTAVSYDVYRGSLAGLVDTDSDGLPDGGYGDCQNHLDSDLTDTVYVDPDTPAIGAGFTYLVAFVDSSGPTGLGNTAAGLRREVTMVCP